MSRERPGGVTALSLFFGAGAGISFTSCLSLLLPGSLLEPMWRLNPRARNAFAGMGAWAVVLLSTVCLACALCAVGLWRGKPWGRRLAIGLLGVNLVADIANVIAGTQPRAAFGVPIAGAMLGYLWKSGRLRNFFRRGAGV